LESLLSAEDEAAAKEKQSGEGVERMDTKATPDAYGALIEPTTLKNPAALARSDRAHLGVSHRQRTAPQMAGGRRDGDEGRRARRIGLAQR